MSKIRVGLVEFRPDRSVALKNNLSSPGEIDVVVFNTAALPIDYIKLKSLSIVTLVSAFRKNPCDIFLIGAYMWPALAAAALSLFTGLRYGLQLVAWYEDDILNRGKGRSLYFLRRLLYGHAYRFIFKHSSLFISNSFNVENKMINRFPNMKNRIFTVHNGIGIRDVNTPPGERNSERKQQIFTASGANFIGKFNCLYIVIEAFEKVAAKHPAFCLIGAVKVSTKEAESRFNKLQDRISASKFADRISFAQNVENMEMLYLQSHLFAYSTPDDGIDGLPRVLLEAQVSSLPVVAGNTDGCPEAIKHGVTGLIVENTADGLAEGMIRLIENPELRDRMAKEGPGWIKSEYSWEKMAAEYGKILRNL